MKAGFISNTLTEIKALYVFLIIASASIIISNCLFLIPDQQILIKLGDGNGLIESTTAIMLFLTSLIFLFLFSKNKYIIYLFLSMLFFVGAGEEISWGQQYLNIKTPEYFLDNNVQSELTIIIWKSLILIIVPVIIKTELLQSSPLTFYIKFSG